MILDGYSRHLRLTGGGQNLVYRPATRSDRDSFRYVFGKLGKQARRAFTFEWIRKHIVTSDRINLGEMYERKPDDFRQLLLTIQGLLPDSSGERWVDIEVEWQQNLCDGIVLAEKFPQLAKRSCESCLKWWYLADGTIKKSNSTGKKEERIAPAPCRTQTGCPKGTPEKQKVLNRANKWAFEHFKQCSAVGQFPDDQIVLENAVIIQKALSRSKIKT